MRNLVTILYIVGVVAAVVAIGYLTRESNALFFAMGALPGVAWMGASLK